MMESIYFKVKNEGKLEGRQEGRQEGKLEGRQEGILLSAKKLVRNGMDMDLVCRMLELSEEAADKLKKEIKN